MAFRAYIHAPMVSSRGSKMSKSPWEPRFCFAAAGKWRGSHDHRLAILSQSYREDWPWSPELLDEAAALRLSAWRGAFSRPLGPRPKKEPSRN